LNGLDERSAPARRYRDLQHSFAHDLLGDTDPSEMQLQLIRSAAGLVVLREALDTRCLNGEKVDSGDYTRITNSLRRLLCSLGHKRKPREVNGGVIDHDDDNQIAELLSYFQNDDDINDATATTEHG
jgi:hypothetical protein